MPSVHQLAISCFAHCPCVTWLTKVIPSSHIWPSHFIPLHNPFRFQCLVTFVGIKYWTFCPLSNGNNHHVLAGSARTKFYVKTVLGQWNLKFVFCVKRDPTVTCVDWKCQKKTNPKKRQGKNGSALIIQCRHKKNFQHSSQKEKQRLKPLLKSLVPRAFAFWQIHDQDETAEPPRP